MQNYYNIWDGDNFRQVPVDEAEQLEKEDKCQILDKVLIGGNELKYRHQFTGYQTRELRAQELPVQVAEQAAPEPDWEDYKDAYKEATGAQRAGKKAVLQWMKDEGII